MYVFACVLDHFYAAALQGKGGPLVVVRERRVLDVDVDALARGVSVGMPVSEARSILVADGHFVDWAEEPFRKSQERWLEILADFSDHVEPIRQHEALADLSGHPRPREAAAKLEERLRRAGFAPRCGLGNCRWIARLSARRGDPLGLAYSDPRSYVADVPVTMLPFDPAHARHLELLGYRTAGDVAGLSSETLSGQFGIASLVIGLAAAGSGDARVRPLFPDASAATRFVFETPPKTRHAFDAGLGSAAAQVGARLKESDLSGRMVELFLEREDASVERISRTFARALTSARDVQVALGLMTSDGPGDPVESLRVRLPGLVSSRRVQLDLQGGRSRSDADESMRVAVQHVRGSYGADAIRLASELPEPRWVRVRRAYMEANGFVWT